MPLSLEFGISLLPLPFFFFKEVFPFSTQTSFLLRQSSNSNIYPVCVYVCVCVCVCETIFLLTVMSLKLFILISQYLEISSTLLKAIIRPPERP